METRNSKLQHLNLIVKAHLIHRFIYLLEQGFKLKVPTGLSIKELLCVHLGISDDYLDNRIQTLFIDGKPVDDVDSAWVFDGARIALSAAMPGLVGATFRKGGQYASFRGTISYSDAKYSRVKGNGKIMLKFFNMVAKELGPNFLQKGIILEGKRFQNFVLRNLEDLKTACTSVHLNGAEIDVTGLKEKKWEDQELILQVTSKTAA